MQIIKFAFLSKDRFSSLALIGFATIFLSHVFINTAMTVGLIPVKGLPFPFISAGGSFLMTSYLNDRNSSEAKHELFRLIKFI